MIRKLLITFQEEDVFFCAGPVKMKRIGHEEHNGGTKCTTKMLIELIASCPSWFVVRCDPVLEIGYEGHNENQIYINAFSWLEPGKGH